MADKIIPTDSDFLKIVNDSLDEIHYADEKEKDVRAVGISPLEGGVCHQNRLITLDNQKQLILRWIQPGEHPDPARREDNYFGGPTSVFREAKILDIAANKAKLPAPKVVYVNEKKDSGKILIVEKVEGIHLRDFFERNNYSLNSFTTGLEHLGSAIAQAHSVKFKAFGSIQPIGISPLCDNYGDYLEKIISRHFTQSLPVLRSYFTEKELTEVFDYFKRIISDANKKLVARKDVKPSFILYDQHSRNFFVGPKTGKPSGFFDLEYAQSAHPNLELGCVGVQLFGFFSGEYVPAAREAFLRGYFANGGSKAIENRLLETVHTSNHLFSAVKSYHEKHDGIRDGWSQEFAKMVLEIVRAGEVKLSCYDAFTNLIRPVTKQPVKPN